MTRDTNESPGFPQLIVLGTQRFVILPEAEYQRLCAQSDVPALPAPDVHGNYPAAEAIRVVLARDIVRSRQALGWSQVELAKRAGLRPETINRLEQGKHTPSIATMEKLDRVLVAAEAKSRRQK